jgi:hypothetical protein
MGEGDYIGRQRSASLAALNGETGSAFAAPVQAKNLRIASTVDAGTPFAILACKGDSINYEEVCKSYRRESFDARFYFWDICGRQQHR